MLVQNVHDDMSFVLSVDAELKNIIDKLANFVARNGPEFEQMTKQKQQDNPKFSFLFGGENYSYYQYKVQTEQASKFCWLPYHKNLKKTDPRLSISDKTNKMACICPVWSESSLSVWRKLVSLATH